LRCKTFNGLDRASLTARGKRNAGWHRFSINQDQAGSAFAAVTAGFHAGQIGGISEIIDEQKIVCDGVLAPATIELNFEQSLSGNGPCGLH
jgi:hypothetical protein